MARSVESYGDAIVGRSFTVVRASEVRCGDVLVDLNCLNIGHEVLLTVAKVGVRRGTRGEFFDFVFGDGREVCFACSCLFGRLIQDLGSLGLEATRCPSHTSPRAPVTGY